MATVDGAIIASLSAARERFFAGERVESGVRERVLTSWQRSRDVGVAPDRVPTVYHPDIDLDSRLVRAAGPVLDDLQCQISGINVSSMLCDNRVTVLQRIVGEPALERWLDSLPVLPGMAFSEQVVGTNALGTALIERRPVCIWGPEHFAEAMHMLSCVAAPIRDPISGRIQGVINLVCLNRYADTAMLGLVTDSVSSIEQSLFEQTCEREKALYRAFLDARRRAHGLGVHLGEQPLITRVLSPQDRLRLLEKATELISADQVGVAIVRLSGDRTATLHSRPVDDAAGKHGIAVEAVLSDDTAWPLATSVGPHAGTRAGNGAFAPPRTGNGHRAPAHALTPPLRPPEPTVAPTEGWLLAVSEPGIGQLAVRARERLSLLCEAGAHIGTTLDVTRTAEEVSEVAVPRFADYVAVDVPDCVLRGQEPTCRDTGIRRIALAAIKEGSWLYHVGALIQPLPCTPQARSLASGQPVLEPRLSRTLGWVAQDPERAQKICAQGIRSLVTVPMRARGVTLGVVSFYRASHRGAFEEDDVCLAEELVSRAAVCVDNARRYTNERNISAELERVTTSLKQSLDRQQRFTTDASHELRTPLAGLRTQLEEAQLHPGETDLPDLLGHALSDVDRLQAIITDLLLLARIEASPVARRKIDLADLAKTEVTRRACDRLPVQLDLADGVLVEVVPMQIARVLHNLVDNAQRHAVESVVVAVRCEGGWAELSVTDDGPGVPETERDRIFQRFARLDTARSRNHGGTGLGLAIARDIAQTHRGTLHVDDVSPHGARFVLRLPVGSC
ncbi:hypothetical protein Aph01nite_78140 [Acrocarpospora phusangensis]|uniref:histidine kinase n=1 Tax=Acrocarpospora phusangensis TaxID=1070424 RepID=A0A919QI65_9ACTN|nr:ATP-binding protein [Acrocarpospora phusangensis]GIH29504.1 hypothetical protein Aph01nite_78140 [Acrocarpospora phusangensis]